MRRDLATPLSILAGSALIAAGLYFGLRERAGDQPSARPTADAPPEPAAADGVPALSSAGGLQDLRDRPAAGPRPPLTIEDTSGQGAQAPVREPPPGGETLAPVIAGGLPGPPTAPLEVQSAVESAAASALANLKEQDFKPRCWAPTLAAAPEPARSTYSVQITFDADGREIARGVSELRDTDSRSDVANCLGRSDLTLQIPPPGQIVSVVVPLHFP